LTLLYLFYGIISIESFFKEVRNVSIPTDSHGRPIVAGYRVKILNGVVGPPNISYIGRVLYAGSKKSTIEYNGGRSIESIENKHLEIQD